MIPKTVVRKRNPLLAMIAAIFMLLPFMLGVNPAQAAETDYDKINQSIVNVYTSYDAEVVVPLADGTSSVYNTETGGTCTGFIVSEDGYIATAGHCVLTDSALELAAKQNVFDYLVKEGFKLDGDASNYNWAVTFSAPTVEVGQRSTGHELDAFKGNTRYVVRVVDSQEFDDGDNALLQVANISDLPTLKIAQDRPAVADKVTSIGFPGNVNGLSDTNRQPPTIKQMAVSSHTTTNLGVPITELDGQIQNGMSGGPTINDKSEVVGVNSSGFDASTVSFITDTGMLRDFLTKNGIDLGVSKSDSSDVVSDEVAKKDGSQSDAVPAAPTDDSSDAVAASDNNNLIVTIVVISVIAVLLIAVAIFVTAHVMRKRSNQSSGTEPDDEPTDTPANLL